jgi:serine/threonine protein kinase
MDKASGQLSNSDAGNEIGKIIAGQFRIVACLGMGGFGTVYKAQQLTLEREVALKVLHSVSAGNDYIFGRFEREAQILSKLEHKNIVDVYSFGIDDSRRCYIAMQLLHGQTLAELLQQNQGLPWRRALNIVTQICKAAEAAHQHGIVHRDLSPRNIMMLQTPEPDLVKVLDFGLCGPLPDNLQSLQSLTQTGALIGSVHYMSPEVCRGNRADRRSDIYSIGCILYECLAGRPPLDADEVVSVMFLQTSEVPPRLRGQDGLGDIPEDLERIVFKAIQKAPDQRFQSAADFESALAAVASGKSPEGNLEDVVLPSVAIRSEKDRRATVVKRVVVAACVSIVSFLAACAWQSKINFVHLFQPADSAELRSAEALMDKGNYEKSVPLFLTVAKSRLNDADATRLVNDLCDLAHLLFDDDRNLPEVGIPGPPRSACSAVLEAALQPGENNPDKFALAKAHLKAAFLFNTTSQLEPKYFQGLSAAQASFCAGETAHVMGWRYLNTDGDRPTAYKYYDEALSHFAPSDSAQITTVWLEKAAAHINDPVEHRHCINKAMAYEASLMAAPDRDSFRALINLIANTNHDYLQIPLIEQLIDHELRLRMSHMTRATLFCMYSAALSKNKPGYAIDYLFRANMERESLTTKTEFDAQIWTDVMNLEIAERRPDMAEAAAKNLMMIASGPGIRSWQYEGTHLKFLAADGLRRAGLSAEAKAQLLKLVPELNTAVEFCRSNIEAWHNPNWTVNYVGVGQDLIAALHLLGREKEAREVLDREVQTLIAHASNPQSLIAQVREYYQNSSTVKPLP